MSDQCLNKILTELHFRSLHRVQDPRPGVHVEEQWGELGPRRPAYGHCTTECSRDCEPRLPSGREDLPAMEEAHRVLQLHRPVRGELQGTRPAPLLGDSRETLAHTRRDICEWEDEEDEDKRVKLNC